MNFEILFQLIVSALVIVFAARLLAHASDEIAKATGLGHLFIGSLFLAASTSAPEFFVDIQATLAGVPNLAAGDLLGSSVMNLLIFVALAFIYKVTRATTRTPGIGTSAVLAALLTAEIGLLIYFQPSWRILGFSVGSILLMGTYLMGMRYLFQKTRQHASPEVSPSRASPRRILMPMLRFFLAAAVIFFVSPWLVSSMEMIGLSTGLGNTFIGTTLLALTTSFPELISSITAVRMGQFDLVIGNIIGSNALNMVIFVFMDWIWKAPPLWSHLSAKNILLAGVVVVNMLLVALTWGKISEKHSWMKSCGTLLILFLSLGCYLMLYVLRENALK